MNRQLLSKLWTNFNSCSLYSRYYLKKKKHNTKNDNHKEQEAILFDILYWSVMFENMLGNIKFYIIFELKKKEKSHLFFIFCSEKFCSYLMYLIHVHKILKGKRWYIFCSTILCCLKNLNMILEFLDASIINMTYH